MNRRQVATNAIPYLRSVAIDSAERYYSNTAMTGEIRQIALVEEVLSAMAIANRRGGWIERLGLVAVGLFCSSMITDLPCKEEIRTGPAQAQFDIFFTVLLPLVSQGVDT